MVDVAVAAVGAAASLSLADVDYDQTGKQEGSQFTFIGMVTLCGSTALGKHSKINTQHPNRSLTFFS